MFAGSKRAPGTKPIRPDRDPVRSLSSLMPSAALTVAVMLAPFGLSACDSGREVTLEVTAKQDHATIASLTGFFDVRTFGAKGDGITDDVSAIRAAVRLATESNGTVYFPPGVYRYSDLPLHVKDTLTIQGAGKRQTLLKPLRSYSGFAIRIEDCWRAEDEKPTGTQLNLDANRAGVVIRDLSIGGDRRWPAAGIQTYDRVDFLNIENVDLVYLKGTALQLGVEGGAAVVEPPRPAGSNLALIRESRFENVFVRLSGDSSSPPLHISTGPEVRDGTNQLEFFGCGIVENYSAAVIENHNRHNHDTRRIQFYGLMLHGRNKHSDAPADALLTLRGHITDISFYGLRANGSHQVDGRMFGTVRIEGDSRPDTPRARNRAPRGLQFIGAGTRNCNGHGFVVDDVESMTVRGIAHTRTIAGSEIVFEEGSVRNGFVYDVLADGPRTIAISTEIRARVRIRSRLFAKHVSRQSR